MRSLLYLYSSTKHKTDKRTPTMLLLLLAASFQLLLINVSIVHACRCFPISLNNSLTRVDTVLSVKVLYELFPPASNGFQNRFFEAYVNERHLGCDIGEVVLLWTAPDSAGCGVVFDRFTDYVITGYATYDRVEWYHYWYGDVPIVSVNSCDYNVLADSVTANETEVLMNLSPDCTDFCQTAECGPSPNLPTVCIDCPDGSCGPKVECRQVTGNCTWVVENCPTCSNDTECQEEAFCSDGLCRSHGSCESAVDCINPSNDHGVITPRCFGEWSCVNSTCQFDCCFGPFDNCVGSCNTTICDEEPVYCFTDVCSDDCPAIFIDAKGSQVCSNSTVEPPPPECTEDSECLETSYCASNGECLEDSTCLTSDDCEADGNDFEYSSPTNCVYILGCNDGMCGTTCI